jgi:tetratricopeptide (TPR) repeat protein
MLAATTFSWSQGDYTGGKALAEEARALHAQEGLPGPLPGSLTLGVCEQLLGNTERATQLYETGVSDARADGDDITLAIGINNLGNVALAQRDFETARVYIEESVALSRRLGTQNNLANALVDLGFVALAENRGHEAADAFRESLSLSHSDPAGLIWAAEGLAAFSLDHGDAVEAVRLHAATTRPRAELGIPSDYFPIGEETRERTLHRAREQLGEAAFAAAWEEGEGLSLEETAAAASRI